jgi:hypothetical protein
VKSLWKYAFKNARQQILNDCRKLGFYSLVDSLLEGERRGSL